MKKSDGDEKSKKGGTDSKKKTIPPIHEGHRERMRIATEKDPELATFSDYQTLELFLSFLIPRRDTNPIAHALIREFGTIYNALHTSPEDLFSVPGMTYNAACFMSEFYAFLRKSEQSNRGKLETFKVSTLSDILTLFGPLFLAREEERIYCVGVDLNDCVKFMAFIGEGFVDSVYLNNSKIMNLITRFKPKKIYIAHNHPSGTTYPSQADINVTKDLFLMLYSLNIILAEHVIFNNDGEYFSFYKNGLFDDLSLMTLDGKEYEKNERAMQAKRKAGVYVFEPKESDVCADDWEVSIDHSERNK